MKYLWLWIFVGCGDAAVSSYRDEELAGTVDGGLVADGAREPDGEGEDAGTDGGETPATGDLATFERILAGEIPVLEGLWTISSSGGWPIETESGYLFAHLDDGGAPYQLAGDHTGWKTVSMTREAGVYWVESTVSYPDGSLYKFVNAQGEYWADPFARRYGYDSYGEYSLVEADGAHLERWIGITDGTLAARTVRVWVPALVPTHHLYVHDGQNLFDPAAPWGGWRLDESLGPSTLVVGIDNTADRMDEYTHVSDYLGGWVGGLGDAYADFVEDVVRPLVEAEYGTADTVGVMGSSLGGLISFHQVLRHPGRYAFAASLSGTFGWGSFNTDNETMIERFAAAGVQPTALYLDSGGGPGSGCVDEDGDGINDDTFDSGDNYCETRQMADTLVEGGYIWDEDLWDWWEPDADHNEAAWAARVWRPLGIFEGL